MWAPLRSQASFLLLGGTSSPRTGCVSAAVGSGRRLHSSVLGHPVGCCAHVTSYLLGRSPCLQSTGRGELLYHQMMLSQRVKRQIWPRFLPLPCGFRLENIVSSGTGFSLPFTCLFRCPVLSRFPIQPGEVLDSLFENGTTGLVCLLPLLALEPVTGVCGGSLGGRALRPQQPGPARGFAPEALMARPLGEAGPACPCLTGADFSCSASPRPRRANSAQNLNSSLLQPRGAWNLQRPRKMSKDSKNMCCF